MTEQFSDSHGIRRATADDAEEVAHLLDAFNREFDTPTPGIAALADRWRQHASSESLIAIIAGRPGIAIAIISFRPNVWSEGPVALLDELYVAPAQRNQGIGSAVLASVEQCCKERQVGLIEINVDIGDTDARRFYERHGFSAIEPDTGEHALYYHRAIDP